MALLGSEERRRVEAAVALAEQKTSGEIVVAVLEGSDDYAAPRAFAAFVAALIVALVVHHLHPRIGVDALLAGTFVLACIIWYFSRAPWLLRWLVPADVAAQAVQRKAYELFAERGVHATREATGLLVLVSELERRVVILGDRGIDREIGSTGWQRYVDRIVAAVAAGRIADGLVEVLGDMGTLLGEKFPRRPDDENELPDHVV